MRHFAAGERIQSFENKDLDFNTATGPQAFGDSVGSKRHRELAEAISGVQDRVRLGAVLTT
ncbi:MAG: hypothetical protein IPL83_12225 [Bdellovibrionales bacterium]|nr:hypothetical protein [Bdellovibrionales bacterium]